MNVIEQGSTTYGVNKAGFTLHSTIHDAREDVHAVLHIHTPEVIGIAALKQGFLQLSQEAFLCGNIGYHDYQGILVDDSERKSIIKDLGKNKIFL